MTVLRDIGHMWVHMYRNSKLVFWVGLIGVSTSVAASLILNLTANDPNMWHVLILFTIGSISMAITSYLAKDSWMILLMSWYTFINGVGLFNLAFGS